MTPRHFRLRDSLAALALCMTVGLASCTDSTSTDLSGLPHPSAPHALTTVPCTASLVTRTVTCGTTASLPDGVSASIIGGQNQYVTLASSNVSYDSTTEIFQFDVTVQNLLNEAMGTPDGTLPDPDGIQVFFHNGPVATGGSGTITVANADGTGTFTGTDQPYFAYHEILPKDAVSSARTWQLSVPPTVTTFAFTVYIETDVQYLLVINEVLANPGGTITDANGEWFEVYNAGTRDVDMQNLVIADSAASGRRPYHLISSSLVVPSGGYVTLGNTTNTTNNGGVPVDYAYGTALTLANSLDAIKIARVVGTDTLTLDRVSYSARDPDLTSVSAKDGISRELKNPALDNSDMDGSNWGYASVTSVYGPGGRGTPKAQNSDFTP